MGRQALKQPTSVQDDAGNPVIQFAANGASTAKLPFHMLEQCGQERVMKLSEMKHSTYGQCSSHYSLWCDLTLSTPAGITHWLPGQPHNNVKLASLLSDCVYNHWTLARLRLWKRTMRSSATAAHTSSTALLQQAH